MRFTKRWIYTPCYNRSALSKGRRTRRTNSPLETRSPQPSSRLRIRTHVAPDRVDLSRSATERNEEDRFGKWRGAAPQTQAGAPCGVCDRHMGDDERCVFSGWIVRRRCAVKKQRGQPTEETIGSGWPLQLLLTRVFLHTEIVPRIHMRYDRASDRGAPQQRQLEIVWRSVNSDVEEVANRHEGDQHAHGGRGDDAEASSTYCGRALDGSAGESGDNHVRVPIPCAQGGSVHARCTLDRVDHIARGQADPRPCVACHSAWPEGSRPPHPPELARGLPITEQEGRWAAVRSALQFAALFQRGDLETEPANYVTNGVHPARSNS